MLSCMFSSWPVYPDDESQPRFSENSNIAMMANQNFYEGLSDEDKKLVQDAADYAFEEIIVHIDGLADEALEKIQSNSDEVTVTRLTDEQIEAFKARAPQVEEKFIEMTGERGKELLEQFKEDLKEVQND